jgi:L-fucose isomerase-like protein
MMDSADADAVAAKKAKYFDYADFTGVEAEKADSIARFGVTLDALIERYSLKAVAIRCWDELEKRYGISPCLAMSVLNDAGIAAACEMDVNNAVMMRAVALASDSAVGLFDVNNNYGDATDRAIMFHCSAIPGSMLSCKGCIGEHLMFKKAYGPRTGVGIFGGEVRQMPLTVGSFKTENGKLCGFVTEGESTADPIEKEFFGTGFVFKKDDNDANAMLNYMSLNGYRHHVAFVRGNWAEAVVEAFSNYLGWEIDRI